MNLLTSLMNEVITSWNDLLKDLSGTGFENWLPGLMNTLSTVLWVLLALVGAAGGIYALYVGIKMARADSAEQREENKKRLINIVISIVVVIVLILFFNTFLPMILGAFDVFKPIVEDAPKTTGKAIRTLLHF
ncbi:MAG: Mbov_0395 family pilin-like conjugal transfer protein [Candidatus Caccovivens sp.]